MSGETEWTVCFGVAEFYVTVKAATQKEAEEKAWEELEWASPYLCHQCSGEMAQCDGYIVSVTDNERSWPPIGSPEAELLEARTALTEERRRVAELDELVETLAALDAHVNEGSRFDYVLTGHRDAARLRATTEAAIARHQARQAEAGTATVVKP